MMHRDEIVKKLKSEIDNIVRLLEEADALHKKDISSQGDHFLELQLRTFQRTSKITDNQINGSAKLEIVKTQSNKPPFW